MASLQSKYHYTMSDSELDSYVRREEDTVIAKLKAALQPCEGVDAVLEQLQKEGKYGMAVVSSSALRRVQASIEKVGQDKFFRKEDVFSAATSLEKPTSKPDPAIYLHACKKLGVDPKECVAVEDSKSGTLSAVRAGIPVVGYVGSYEAEERSKMTDLLMETGAKVVMQDWKVFGQTLKDLETL